MITAATRQQITADIRQSIETASRELYPAEHRKHLGASIIGHECRAYAWNTFRWLHLEQHEGKMRRLFNRGHREEIQIVELLRKAGFKVYEKDANGNQFRILGSNGHFGGSLDGVCELPAKYQFSEPVLLEFKTFNQKKFDELTDKKVKVAKPEHWAQMCSYGKPYNIRLALYCGVNKNTDEIEFDLLELDWKYADEIYMRADTIINSQVRPLKISPTKTYFKCKYCHFSPICHDGVLPEKNCRSCKFAVPVADGKWACTSIKAPIAANDIASLPDNRIAVGCSEWKPIINGG